MSEENVRELEWPEGDPKWTEEPKIPERSDEEVPRIFGRGECPFVPVGDYIVLWVKGIEFYTRQGLVVPTQTGGPGGYQCPILTVVDVGPDVEEFRRGDTVICNPRNAEVTYEWSDPEGLGTEHFLIVKAENIIGHVDQDIVHQFSVRAQRCREDQARSHEVGISKPGPKKIIRPGDPQQDD